MTSSRTLRRALALAATMTLASTLPLSLPTTASCLPLQLPPADAADTIVLVGTVRSIDGIRTELDVDAWFLGAEPTDTVVVAGGRDPELITSQQDHGRPMARMLPMARVPRVSTPLPRP